jgi:hypothetical protein
MVRRAYIHLMTVVVMAVISVPSSRAQSLADAARRAAEQRERAAGSDVKLLTDRDLAPSARPADSNRDVMSLVLTMPMLQQYSGVRTAILRAMVQSPDVTGQVIGAISRGTRVGIDALEREYTMVPTAVDAIRAGQMSVHNYVVTEVAFMAAVGVLAGKLPIAGAPAGTLANVEFLKQHQPEVEMLWKDALVMEEQITRRVGTPH